VTQTRYHTRTNKLAASRIFDAWDAAFEDEDAPVGVTEIDEAADIHEVSIYFDDETGGAGRLGDVTAAVANLDTPPIEVEAIPDTDWMKAVLAELKPVRAGRFIVHGAHDRGLIRANDLGIEIEAGQAFGTGHHGTTAGCLSMIDILVRRKQYANALDLGTGSAVLAIGIAKLARIPVLATDIDPVAIEVARENIENNGVANLVQAVVATGMASHDIRAFAPYAMIVANILAQPLIKLAPAVERQLAAGGDVILSGILERQRQAVLAAYRTQGLVHRQTLRRGEWVTLHLSR
jgi:ribosomal protein L11 methyltransferase